MRGKKVKSHWNAYMAFTRQDNLLVKVKHVSFLKIPSARFNLNNNLHFNKYLSQVGRKVFELNDDLSSLCHLLFPLRVITFLDVSNSIWKILSSQETWTSCSNYRKNMWFIFHIYSEKGEHILSGSFFFFSCCCIKVITIRYSALSSQQMYTGKTF